MLHAHKDAHFKPGLAAGEKGHIWERFIKRDVFCALKIAAWKSRWRITAS